MAFKIVNYIDAPHGWVGTDPYSSHLQMLWLALSKTSGNVQELGCGEGSTMMLAKECAKQKRVFGSYESDERFAKRYEGVVIKIANYMDVYLWKPNILFIDSAPGEQRKDLVELHKDNADVIILHDTEKGVQDIYGITEVLKSFKYRLDYCPHRLPATTALSNKINVEEWINRPDLTSSLIQEEQRSMNP